MKNFNHKTKVSIHLKNHFRDAFQKKKAVWRENVPTGGEGVQKNFKNSLLEIPFYLGTFSRGEGFKSLVHYSFQNILLVGLKKCLQFVE